MAKLKLYKTIPAILTATVISVGLIGCERKNNQLNETEQLPDLGPKETDSVIFDEVPTLENKNSLADYLTDLERIYLEYSKLRNENYREISQEYPLIFGYEGDVFAASAYYSLKENGYDLNNLAEIFDKILVYNMFTLPMNPKDKEKFQFLASLVGDEVDPIEYFYHLASGYHQRTCSEVHVASRYYDIQIQGVYLCNNIMELEAQMAADLEESIKSSEEEAVRVHLS